MLWAFLPSFLHHGLRYSHLNPPEFGKVLSAN